MRVDASEEHATMEQEGQAGAEESPVSLRKRSEEEEGTTTRRKRRKKELESIIVYRSEAEDQGNDAGEGCSAEEARGLSTPTWDESCDIPPDSRFVTLTGTITRGKRKGQVVDIHVTLTDKELRDMARSKERLDAECEERQDAQRSCTLGPGRGPHVLLWSLSCSPFIFVLSFITSFYYGTLTWYNVFLVYNEERTFLHKITVCPFLILSYPILIMVLCLCMGVYAAGAQLSWVCSEWWQAVRDLEKGFCGWLCGKLGLEDCAPYSVVELLDSDTLSGTLQMKKPEDDEQTSAV